jgi:hypothetical protein
MPTGKYFPTFQMSLLSQSVGTPSLLRLLDAESGARVPLVSSVPNSVPHFLMSRILSPSRGQ